MRRRFVVALAALAVGVAGAPTFAAPAAPARTAVQYRHFKHHPECHTERCARHADRLWARHEAKLVAAREAREERRAATAMSALEACIIREESGGNPKAVSGIYMGIGQWEESRWLSDGGGRFASTPLGASYAEQEIILRGEGEAGMIDQQGQYDGCG